MTKTPATRVCQGCAILSGLIEALEIVLGESSAAHDTRVKSLLASAASMARETHRQALVFSSGPSRSQGTWINVQLDPHVSSILSLKAAGLGQEPEQLAGAVLRRAFSGRVGA